MKVKNLEEMDYEDLEEKVRGRDRQEGGRFQERRKRKIARSQLKKAVMRVELKNIEIGSCCSASSEASTRAGLGSATLATRWADHLGSKEARVQGVDPRLLA